MALINSSVLISRVFMSAQEVYNLDDSNETPKENESLREFFARTKEYWTSIASGVFAVIPSLVSYSNFPHFAPDSGDIA